MTQKGLGGAFAWDLGGDSKDWSHLKALNSAVEKETSVGGDDFRHSEI